MSKLANHIALFCSHDNTGYLMKKIGLSYNDVKRRKPFYSMSHRTMQVVGEPIDFIKTPSALGIVAQNCPLGHRIKRFPRLTSL
jgi:hypothetical protein